MSNNKKGLNRHEFLTTSMGAAMGLTGYSVGFNGTKGRLDVRIYHNQPCKVPNLADIRLTRNFKDTQTFSLTSGEGGHWGADQIMQERIFRNPGDDQLEQGAGSRDGVLSILIGIAARRSIEQERTVSIEELVKI